MPLIYYIRGIRRSIQNQTKNQSSENLHPVLFDSGKVKEEEEEDEEKFVLSANRKVKEKEAENKSIR